MILRHDFAVIADRGQDHEVRAGAERADLGHFRRPETARERKLALAADLLAAKQQHRMLLERGAHRRIDRIVGGDIGERHAANFSGETRTQRDDVHWHNPPYRHCEERSDEAIQSCAAAWIASLSLSSGRATSSAVPLTRNDVSGCIFPQKQPDRKES